MIAAGVQDRNGKAAAHLQSLQALAAELEKAMQAIASNSLPDLEESIANQQMLTARLSGLADDLCLPLESHPVSPAVRLDEDIMRQIRAASETLQDLNRRYAALLRHSSRSVALMISLFHSFQGNFQEVSGPGLKHQTWSCRM